MRATQEQIYKIADSLQGTSQSLYEVVLEVVEVELEELENAMEVCEHVDQTVFECAVCGWWCEAGDWIENNPNPGNGDICTKCGSEFVDND